MSEMRQQLCLFKATVQRCGGTHTIQKQSRGCGANLKQPNAGLSEPFVAHARRVCSCRRWLDLDRMPLTICPQYQRESAPRPKEKRRNFGR